MADFDTELLWEEEQVLLQDLEADLQVAAWNGDHKQEAIILAEIHVAHCAIEILNLKRKVAA